VVWRTLDGNNDGGLLGWQEEWIRRRSLGRACLSEFEALTTKGEGGYAVAGAIIEVAD
jgi:hypothetical protein